jgi:predicted AAA+ superfamily ATPase
MQLDFTFERQIMLEKEYSQKKGELKKLILLISKKKAKNCSVSETADMLETDETLVQKVYDALETYDAETQWEDIIELIK